MSDDINRKTAIVSGGSSGLGRAIVLRLVSNGYDVTVIGRDASKLAAVKTSLGSDRSEDRTSQGRVQTLVADVTKRDEVNHALSSHLEAFGHLDALVNVVGRSDRGLIESLTTDHLLALFRANVISALICSQVCLPELRKRRGAIVNIGSLAGHVAPRFMGGYVIAKHALVGLTGQLRLECEPDGVHVGLVSPGPIDDPDRKTNNRYDVDESSSVPMEAAAPGGGAKVKSLTAEQVASAVVRCAEEQKAEIILPRKTRLLMAIQSLWPSLGRRILRRKTS